MNTSKAGAKKTTVIVTPAAAEAITKANDLPADFDDVKELTPEEMEQTKQPLPAPVSKDGLSVAALSDDKFIDSIFDRLDGGEDVKELTGAYIDFKHFKEGEKRSYIATEVTTFNSKNRITDETEIIPAVKLMDRERNVFICASTVVVNTIKSMESLPAPVIIQVNGMKKGANGSYYNVKVFTL